LIVSWNALKNKSNPYQENPIFNGIISFITLNFHPTFVIINLPYSSSSHLEKRVAIFDEVASWVLDREYKQGYLVILTYSKRTSNLRLEGGGEKQVLSSGYNASYKKTNDSLWHDSKN
jgi:hypothetical protein